MMVMKVEKYFIRISSIIFTLYALSIHLIYHLFKFVAKSIFNKSSGGYRSLQTYFPSVSRRFALANSFVPSEYRFYILCHA